MLLSNLITICLLGLLVSAVSSFYIKPIQSGTIDITDAQLRENKIINRLLKLKFDKEFYKAHKDINVVASITSLAMDQKLNFHFDYTIVCPFTECQLNFTLIRYTQQVNPYFKYRLAIDYLVAHGLKIMNLNMTSFQQHIMLRDMQSYNQNNQLQDYSKKIPYNNKDAMYMLLIPNGFNNVTLTGHVVYSYILSTTMYVVHYMDHSNGHGEHDSMGWPQKMNYIRYKIVFIPPYYIQDSDCQTEDKFSLLQNYERLCKGGSKTKWFFAFKSTKQTKVQGQFFELRSGYSFKLNATPSRYGLMAFPFEKTQYFVDERVHEYKWQVQYQMVGLVAGIIIGITLFVVVVGLTYLYLRKLFRIKKNKFSKISKHTNLTEQKEQTQDAKSSHLNEV